MEEKKYIFTESEMRQHPVFKEARAICRMAEYELLCLVRIEGKQNYPYMNILNLHDNGKTRNYYPEIFLKGHRDRYYLKVCNPAITTFDSIEEYQAFIDAQNEAFRMVKFFNDSILTKIDEWPLCRSLSEIFSKDNSADEADKDEESTKENTEEKETEETAWW